MIMTITAQRLSAVAWLLPDRLSGALGEPDTLCLAATDGDDTPAAVLLARQEEPRMELQWLFTAPEARGKGYGTALLERLAEIARRMGGVECVTACLPTDSPALGFLLSSGFAASTALDVEYRAPVGALQNESLWRRPCQTADIVPLDEISSSMLDAFGQLAEQQGNPAALPLPLKWAQYIPELSFAALGGGRMSAVLLAERDGEHDVSLSALHAVSGGGETVRQLLYAAGTAAIRSCPPETTLHFVAVNPVSRRLAAKLLKHADRRYICRLTLPVEPSEEVKP